MNASRRIYRSFAPARSDTASLAVDLRKLGSHSGFVSLWETARPVHETMPRMALTIDDGLDSFSGELVELFKRLDIAPCLILITKEAHTWTPPVCEMNFGEEGRLQSCNRPVDGVYLLASMVCADGRPI